MSEAVSQWTAREMVLHVLMQIDADYPHLGLRDLHTYDARWGQSDFSERQFWREFFNNIVKHIPFVEGTEHRFDPPEGDAR